MFDSDGLDLTSTVAGRADAASAGADSRKAVAYLVAQESHEYIAIMRVLEESVTELTPAEISRALAEAGTRIDERLVEKRLDQLRDWAAASARTDISRVRRHADLLARNWRWTATPVGRQVQRFYSTWPVPDNATTR